MNGVAGVSEREGEDHDQAKNSRDRSDRKDRQCSRFRTTEGRLSCPGHGAPRRWPQLNQSASGNCADSNKSRPTSTSRFSHCEKVLHYQNHWQYVSANMLIGYARVSTNEQDTATQVAALKSAGCERIFREKASGGRWDRPELHRLLDQLRKGDVLDRLSRSLRDVLTIMEQIAEAKAGFRSLSEAIDTTSPAGRMMMQMLGAFAEFERAMLRERTKAGLESARRQGRIGGRRPKLRPQQQAEIIKMVSRGRRTAADAARLFNVHPATVSRLLAHARMETAMAHR